MANPRQRRKLKSKSYQKVRTQKADKFKKHPPIRGPKVIQEAWDRKKTLLQNYQALGLAASLSTATSGGVEKPLSSGAGSINQAVSSDPAPISGLMTEPRETHLAMTNTNTNGLRKGFGRIVRDDDGNVIRVEMPDEDGTTEMNTDSPTGNDEEDLVAGSSGKLSTPTPLESANKTQKTEVVEELEKLANRKLVQPRYASQHEMVWLRSLVETYGDDLDRMARDRRLNVWQRTAGEIKRTIAKAGGIEKLRG